MINTTIKFLEERCDYFKQLDSLRVFMCVLPFVLVNSYICFQTQLRLCLHPIKFLSTSLQLCSVLSLCAFKALCTYYPLWHIPLLTTCLCSFLLLPFHMFFFFFLFFLSAEFLEYSALTKYDRLYIFKNVCFLFFIFMLSALFWTLVSSLLYYGNEFISVFFPPPYMPTS